LAVETMGYATHVFKIVKCPIGIIFCSCCENHELKVL
jgi:hypothetical protein